MVEEIDSSETSVITRATRSNITEGVILRIHGSENPFTHKCGWSKRSNFGAILNKIFLIHTDGAPVDGRKVLEQRLLSKKYSHLRDKVVRVLRKLDNK
jgi:hypothetical protein